MKRSPLARGKAPERRTPLRARSTIDALRPRPTLRRDGSQRARPSKSAVPWRLACADVDSRSGGRCEARVDGVCTGRGEHHHHVILRSRGGPDESWNLLHACNACHTWIHANPAAATEAGLMRSAPT